MIEITSETIERTQTLMAGIPKGAERALSSAINRGLSHTKTQAFKQVKTVYAVKQSALNEATTTKAQRASTGNLAGYISFSGVKIPLYKFQVTPKAPGTGKKVRAGVMKGGGATFDNAFIAEMKSGHIGIFERITSKRLPIEEKMGLSAAQMVKNEVIMDQLTKEAQEKVDERLKHEIDRILNGYGG